MRRQELLDTVTQLVAELFDDDVAEAICTDDAFPALAYRLQHFCGGDQHGINQMNAALALIAESLEDNTLDWLVDDADNPAAFIASRL